MKDTEVTLPSMTEVTISAFFFRASARWPLPLPSDGATMAAPPVSVQVQKRPLATVLVAVERSMASKSSVVTLREAFSTSKVMTPAALSWIFLISRGVEAWVQERMEGVD